MFHLTRPRRTTLCITQHQERLRQRRQDLQQQRRKALRDLLEFEPSSKEAMSGGWAFLLRDEQPRGGLDDSDPEEE